MVDPVDVDAPQPGGPDSPEPPDTEPSPAVEPEAAEPKTVEPEIVEPEAVEPEAVEPEAGEPEAGEPETAVVHRDPDPGRATGRLSGLVALAVGLVAGAAVLLAHVLAALRAGSAVATVGEARLAAAAFAARGIDLGLDPLPPADRFAARQLAALQVLLPTGGLPVVDATRWACLAAGLVVALLLWAIQRNLGLAAPAAAAGVLVAGALPPVIAVHAGITAAAPAALWLAAAAWLVIRMRGRGVPAVAGLLALVAVLTAPLLAAAVLALGAHAVLDRSVLRALAGPVRIALGAVLGVLAVVALLMALGDGPLAGVGGPLLGDAGAIGCALLGVVVLGLGWWRARWLRPLLSPAVLLLAVVLFVPGPARAAAAVLVIPVLALGVGVLVDEVAERRWVVPVVLVAAVATAVAAVVSPVEPAVPAPAASALVGWARTELDTATALRADPLDRAEFVAAGFPADRLRGAADPAGPDELLVVSARPDTGDPVGATCPPGSALAGVDRGAGGVPTAICPVDAAASRAVAGERAARAEFGAALTANPALTLAPAAADALRAGAVDARVMAVLATMTSTHAIGVADFPVVALDAAGTPLRRVLLSTVDGVPAAGDPLPVVRSWLGGQQPPFVPTLVDPDGSALLVGYPAPSRTGLLPP